MEKFRTINVLNIWHLLQLQPGAQVMHLNNDMINQGVCNGTIGIVKKIIQEMDQIHVSFLVINH